MIVIDKARNQRPPGIIGARLAPLVAGRVVGHIAVRVVNIGTRVAVAVGNGLLIGGLLGC